ncbi:hypothetical protein ACFFR3_40550 [Nonomuraea salmonea]|jgi:hypothetical protein|uniref:Transposase n=1 Tax=Nonomuraea salmonea TaxID=46181 RepID=A0ABV5NZS2_9ACTN
MAEVTETDPHIHVDRKVLQAGADFRNVLASTLGGVPDAPSEVTTGCGLKVPYAMTSPHPERVTCLPCREHACREHLNFADQVERLGRHPGTALPGDRTAEVAQWARDRARKFASG